MVGFPEIPMRVKFFREFGFELRTVSAKYQASPVSFERCPKNGYHAIFSTFRIAPTIRSNSARSVASCCRPAAVSV